MSTVISRAAKRDRVNAQHEVLGRAERWLESDRGQAALMGVLAVIAIVSGFIPK